MEDSRIGAACDNCVILRLVLVTICKIIIFYFQCYLLAKSYSFYTADYFSTMFYPYIFAECYFKIDLRFILCSFFADVDCRIFPVKNI